LERVKKQDQTDRAYYATDDKAALIISKNGNTFIAQHHKGENQTEN
jgi:hypothetical protein